MRRRIDEGWPSALRERAGAPARRFFGSSILRFLNPHLRLSPFIGGSILLLAGCRGAQPVQARAPGGSGFPVTVIDDAGRRVTVAKPPERIVSLSPGHTETLYALGLGDRVVAADSYSDYPPAVRSKATLRCWPAAPVEKIVSLQPDLVLVMVMSRGDEFLRQMDAAHIPALELFPNTYARTVEEIGLLGRVTGATAAAARMADGMRARADAVGARVRGGRPPRVYFEIDGSDPARPWVASRDGFYNDLIRLANGKNVFGEVAGAAAQVNLEQIVARDPEVILVGGGSDHPEKAEAVARRPGWNVISAVRNHRVFSVDGQLMTRPGPRLADGLEEIARRLHPERFR